MSAIARKIAFYRQHFSLPAPASQQGAAIEPGTVVDEELKEAFSCLKDPDCKLPLYFKPADIIDEFGNLLPTRLANSNNFVFNDLGREKIKNYFKKRFPHRHALSQRAALLAAQLDASWRTRNRRREAEWGDPEDLGLPAVNHIAGHVGGKTWRDALCEWIPEQECMRVKTLLPAIFVCGVRGEEGSNTVDTAQVNTAINQANTTIPSTIVQWTMEERKTFIELFLQYPKNFARISASLPLKSTEQCVQFYYLHKREYRFKQLVVTYRRALAGQRRLTLQGGASEEGGAAEANEKRRVGRPKMRRE